MNLHSLGLKTVGDIHRNVSPEKLVKTALKRNEGVLGMNGALMVDTGKYTGRSPKDKFIVEEISTKDNVWWGSVNQPVSEAVFDELYQKVIDYYNTNEDGLGAFVFDGYSGAEAEVALPIRMIAKKAWQALFVNNMFIQPESEQLIDFKPKFTIINASPVLDDEWEKHGLHSETFYPFSTWKKVSLLLVDPNTAAR